VSAQRVRLPEPPQRRATSEGNRALTVSVTPSTLEAPQALPGSQMPYTSVLGGYGPLTQFRVGLYDARLWGPVLGLTEVDGRAGWGWSGWRAKEWLDWGGIGRLGLDGQGFSWTRGALSGGQSFLSAGVEAGESERALVRLDVNRGALDDTTASASPLAASTFSTSLARATGRLELEPMGDHQATINMTAQARTWGALSGPEAYVSALDFWSLSDAVQLEAGLGGGYWGFEPILDPKVAFHYRPQGATHLFASLRTQSELPDFESLYMRRPATRANAALQSERVEGLAEVGGSHRLNETVWGSLTGGLRRSFRHLYWADPTASGLWTPLNASGEQWTPTVDGSLQLQWLPNLTQDVGYRWRGTYPLGTSEHRLGTGLDARLLDQKLGLGVGVEGRYDTLSTLQLPGGGSGYGVFGEAEARYALTRDLTISLTASDVPLALVQPGSANTNYFVPIPLVTVNAQYQF
jgi:hypothetical protein